MTFPVTMFMLGVMNLLTVFLEYKCPHNVTGVQIKRSRSVQICLGISALVLIEFMLIGTFYSSYILAIAFTFLTLGFIGHFVRRQYLSWMAKNRANFNSKKAEVLFYLHLKVRQFCSTDQMSNTFFYKNDGLIVFFGDPDTSFEAMTPNRLVFFQESLVQSTMGHVDFGGFLVIKDKDGYISLSSSEFEMLNVPVTDINQDHLTLIKMARI